MLVEVGFLLDKELSYYEELLKSNGCIYLGKNDIYDKYYTNKELDGLTENEMKKACIRLRSDKDIHSGAFQNLSLISGKEFMEPYSDELLEEIKFNGFHLVFDTHKLDIHYQMPNCNGDIQLQPVDNIGLILYYYNEDYRKLSLEEQRIKLIDELNSCGFNFKYDDLGLDKLRTLYYKKKMYSKNQNK